MREYLISRVADRDDFERKLHDLGKAAIDLFPWGRFDAPASYGILAYDERNIHVFLRSYEKVIRAGQHEQNGAIYTDSCLEFFFMPDVLDGRYFNFECNPCGVFFLSVGKERADRMLIAEENASYFGMKAMRSPLEHNGESWSVSYSIPYAFMHKYISSVESGTLKSMKGNFYKCGNSLPKPHWGCWNSIETAKPDFHRPEFFGSLLFE
jgi:hypothetical protein